MEERERPSMAMRIVAPLLFIVGSTSALVWFFYKFIHLLGGIQTDIVVFDKGSCYMLGVGMGLLVLAIATVKESWLGRDLTEKQALYLTRLAIVSLVLLFTFPHGVHYAADGYLSSHGYSVCEKASHQWRFIRTIVYVHDPVECHEKLKALYQYQPPHY